jgi:hypothetical protein
VIVTKGGIEGAKTKTLAFLPILLITLFCASEITPFSDDNYNKSRQKNKKFLTPHIAKYYIYRIGNFTDFYQKTQI